MYVVFTARTGRCLLSTDSWNEAIRFLYSRRRVGIECVIYKRTNGGNRA